MFGEAVREQLRSIGLLPHQVGFVENVIGAPRPARFLLVAPPGLGRSEAIVAVVRMLAPQSGGSIRSLVIVPATLQPVWAAVLRRVGTVEPIVVDAPAYRRLQADTASEQNPWAAHPCIVTSIDFLTKEGRVDEALGVPWDIVVLDEVHRCPPVTLRGAAAQQLWERGGVPVAIAATTLADPSEWRLEWLVRDPNVNVVRWSSRAVKDWDGAPIFPARQVVMTSYQLSALEQEFETRLNDFINSLADHPVGEVWRSLLRHRWQSSLYAIDQSLRRIVAGLEVPYIALDESAEAAAGEVSDVVPVLTDLGLTTEKCQELLDLLEQIPEDSKWAACKSLLRNIKVGEECSVVIFTEFADTAEYVANLAESRGWRTHLLTAVTPVEARWQAVASAQAEPGILILTTAASEGLNLSVSGQALHYDLPLKPMRLLQRYGRIERLGSRFRLVNHHVLVAEGSAVESILGRLEREVKALEEMFGRE